MSIEKNQNGSLVISDIIKGYLVKRIFYGYTKAQAVKIFKAEHTERG